MTDLSLNSQLGAKLRGIQEAWDYDSPSDALAVIFDSMIHGWSVPMPLNSTQRNTNGYRVRIKARHIVYFEERASYIGCGVPELARSVLVQWIFAAEPSHAKGQTLLKAPNTPIQSLKRTNSYTVKRTKSASTTTSVAPVTTSATPALDTVAKKSARDSLKSLMT